MSGVVVKLSNGCVIRLASHSDTSFASCYQPLPAHTTPLAATNFILKEIFRDYKDDYSRELSHQMAEAVPHIYKLVTQLTPHPAAKETPAANFGKNLLELICILIQGGKICIGLSYNLCIAMDRSYPCN